MDRAQLQELHKELWDLRDELDATTAFKTPNTLDSLRYAFSEAGEAMSDFMRMNRDHARNHAKEPDIYGELADCALMLMTALGRKEVCEPYGVRTVETQWGLDYLALWTGIALDRAGRNYPMMAGSTVSAIAVCLGAIAAIDGMDFAAEMRKRMAKWRTRWGAPSA